MKKRLGLVFLAAMLFVILSGIGAAQASSVTEGIVSVAGKDIDARVKLRETPKGKIIGQYYHGAHYTADEEKGDWAHVTIGGRSGWMMKSYLQDGIPAAVNAPCGRIAYPDPDGCIALTDLEGREHRIPENTFYMFWVQSVKPAFMWKHIFRITKSCMATASWRKSHGRTTFDTQKYVPVGRICLFMFEQIQISNPHLYANSIRAQLSTCFLTIIIPQMDGTGCETRA